MIKAFIAKISDLDRDVKTALEWIDIGGLLKNVSRVFIKPNLTYPYYKEGVTTSPRIMESLVRALTEFNKEITLVESDGGYHSWKAEDAFNGHGLYDMGRKYGVRLLNLCKSEKININVKVKEQDVEIPFPRVLIDDDSLFITMPVPKVHSMTGVSLAFKNQWGCIPDTMRLRYHWCFNEAIVAINKSILKSIVVADGTYMLDRNGPMDGEAVKMDLIIASDNIGAFELAACRVLGVAPHTIQHLELAKQRGMITISLDDIKTNQPIDNFHVRTFKLEKTVQNRLAKIAFCSRRLTHIGYDSTVGNILHNILYKVRGKPVWHE